MDSVITQVSANPATNAENSVNNDTSGGSSGGISPSGTTPPTSVPATGSSNTQLQASSKDPAKKRSSNFLCSIICCLGKKSSKQKNKDKDVSANANNTGDVIDSGGAKPSKAPQKALLPDLRPDDSFHDKKCIVIDLDETLVHSSFKPISNADFIVPVEIDNVIHQVYVLKRPFVDEFLCRMGELFECVLFTASLAKVPCSSWFDDMDDRELLDLIPLLEKLSKVDSVYAVLKNKEQVQQHLQQIQSNSGNNQSSLKRSQTSGSSSAATAAVT